MSAISKKNGEIWQPPCGAMNEGRHELLGIGEEEDGHFNNMSGYLVPAETSSRCKVASRQFITGWCFQSVLNCL